MEKEEDFFQMQQSEAHSAQRAFHGGRVVPKVGFVLLEMTAEVVRDAHPQ